MAEYTKKEAREWAKADMKGLCGCLLPTFNSSITKINERAIRHDVRLEKEMGYWGTLLVTECGTTNDEMRQVIDIGVDEAKKVGLRTMLLASFPTLEQNLDMIRYSESAGVDSVLIPYPLMFYPQSEQEVYDYTKAVADATNLGVVLFGIFQWNFGRLHPSTFSPALMRRLVDDCENVVAIKNEIGGPGVGGVADVFRQFGDEVIVTDPFEQNAPAWIMTFGMQWMGTSNYEYMGRDLVKMWDLLQAKRWDEAMEIYWRLHPARKANAAIGESVMAGGSLVHRQAWKYQAWLNGFNGGPIRQPHLRVNDNQMKSLRQGLVSSGITPCPEPDAEYFVGRNPID